jgi:hypothetical protein
VAAIYKSMFGKGAGFEHVAFLGYVPLLLACVAIRARAALRTFWLIALLLFASLALGPVAHVGGHAIASLSPAMPYQLFARLPYGDIPRVPARFVVMALLCLCVLAGCGGRVLLQNRRSSAGVAITTALAGLILFENAAIPLEVAAVDVPPYFDVLGRAPIRTGLLEVPIPDDPATVAERMLFQTRHAQPVYQGYLARGVPPLPFDLVPGFRQFKALSPDIDDVVRYEAGAVPAISRRALAALGAGRVVIEKRFFDDPALVERARATADELFGVSAVEYEDESILAYAVPAEREAMSSVLWLDTGWSYLERLDQTDGSGRTLRWRWMGDHARVALLAAKPADVKLKIRAQAFGHQRNLRLSTGRAEIATLPIATTRGDYETATFPIPAGLTFIEFSSLDGAGAADGDQRRLSVALFDIALIDRE